MKCKRLNEVIELLQPAWQKEPDLNLLQFLQKLAKEDVYKRQESVCVLVEASGKARDTG